MRLNQILSAKRSHIVRVSPTTTVAEAIALMGREHVGAVLVIDADAHLLGVLSERDVVYGLAAHPEGLLARAVIEVARRDTPVASPQDTVKFVMEAMTASRARHVPVVEHGRVVGVVSIGDVVKWRLDEQSRENAVLQEIARSQFFAG